MSARIKVFPGHFTPRILWYCKSCPTTGETRGSSWGSARTIHDAATAGMKHLRDAHGASAYCRACEVRHYGLPLTGPRRCTEARGDPDVLKVAPRADTARSDWLFGDEFPCCIDRTHNFSREGA